MQKNVASTRIKKAIYCIATLTYKLYGNIINRCASNQVIPISRKIGFIFFINNESWKYARGLYVRIFSVACGNNFLLTSKGLNFRKIVIIYFSFL